MSGKSQAQRDREEAAARIEEELGAEEFRAIPATARKRMIDARVAHAGAGAAPATGPTVANRARQSDGAHWGKSPNSQVHDQWLDQVNQMTGSAYTWRDQPAIKRAAAYFQVHDPLRDAFDRAVRTAEKAGLSRDEIVQYFSGLLHKYEFDGESRHVHGFDLVVKSAVEARAPTEELGAEDNARGWVGKLLKLSADQVKKAVRRASR